MRGFIRRWLQLDSPAAPLPTPSAPPSAPTKPKRPLAVRVAELHSRVDFLEGELNKLRGKITGGLAHRPKPEEVPQSHQDAPESTNGHERRVDTPPDRWMATAHAKEAQRRVLPR